MSPKPEQSDEIAALERRLQQLRERIEQLGPLMRGSVVVIGTRNKQPYFSVAIKGKTRLIYLGKRREPRAREYLENYRQLQQILEEMTLLNMRLLKLDTGR